MVTEAASAAHETGRVRGRLLTFPRFFVGTRAVVGLRCASGESLATAERFDPASATWAPVVALKQALSHFS
eukprot:1089003-Amphidinium_carterae.1